jgi:hypothetical protein
MVIISNGSSKFHLAVTAEEFLKSSKLPMLLNRRQPGYKSTADPRSVANEKVPKSPSAFGERAKK